MKSELWPEMAQKIVTQLEKNRETGKKSALLTEEAQGDLQFLLSEPPLNTSQAITPLPTTDTEERHALLESLRQQIATDARWPSMGTLRTTMVFSVGNPSASIMLVGEAPGAQEESQEKPFVGPAGQLLDKILAAMGLQRPEVYITNVVKYRPALPGHQGTRNRKPTPEEMAIGIPFLQREIAIVQPRVLIALGASALEGLLGEKKSITRMRGSFLTYQGIPLMPTYHPSYLLRNNSLQSKREAWEDMLQVMEKLSLPISKKQRGYFLPKN